MPLCASTVCTGPMHVHECPTFHWAHDLPQWQLEASNVSLWHLMIKSVALGSKWHWFFIPWHVESIPHNLFQNEWFQPGIYSSTSAIFRLPDYIIPGRELDSWLKSFVMIMGSGSLWFCSGYVMSGMTVCYENTVSYLSARRYNLTTHFATNRLNIKRYCERK